MEISLAYYYFEIESVSQRSRTVENLVALSPFSFILNNAERFTIKQSWIQIAVTHFIRTARSESGKLDLHPSSVSDQPASLR